MQNFLEKRITMLLRGRRVILRSTANGIKFTALPMLEQINLIQQKHIQLTMLLPLANLLGLATPLAVGMTMTVSKAML